MNIIFLLIPLSLILVGVIIAVLFWAIRSGQFDDMEGPAHRILMDDDKPDTTSSSEQENSNNEDQC